MDVLLLKLFEAVDQDGHQKADYFVNQIISSQ